MAKAKPQRQTFRILDAAANRELPTRLSCKAKPEEKLIGGKWLGHLPAILDLVEDGFLRCEIAARNPSGKPYHIHNLRITECGYDKLYELRSKTPLAYLRHAAYRGITLILTHITAAVIGAVVGYIISTHLTPSQPKEQPSPTKSISSEAAQSATPGET